MKHDPYTGSTSFEVEQELCFNKYWIFAGITSLIPNKGDYLVRNIGGKNIVIRNSGEDFVAFLNACPHRQAPLYTNEYGNGPIVCPFHGWAFGGDGKLLGIPFEKSKYCFTEQVNEQIKLTTFQLRSVEKFIFIKLNDSNYAIEDQIPDTLIKVMEDVSHHLDKDISITRIPISTNWKLVPEITFDPLHVPFVHKNTLLNTRGYDAAEVVKDLTDVSQSSNELPRHLDDDAEFTSDSVTEKSLCFAMGTKNPGFVSESWHSIVERYGSEDLYYDYFIFPNLHLVSADGGFSFSYEAFFPECIDKTIIDYVFTTAKRKKEDRVFPVVHMESLKIGLKVFEEDISMMESVGGNLTKYRFISIHGNYENHIVKWRSFFQNLVNDHE